jgi:hypothetical protein
MMSEGYQHCQRVVRSRSWSPFAPLPPRLPPATSGTSSHANISTLAVQLSGHLRDVFMSSLTVKPLTVTLAALRAAYDVSLFVHTWHTLDASTPSYRTRPAGANASSDESVESLMRLLQPTMVLVQRQGATALQGRGPTLFSGTHISYQGMQYLYHGIASTVWMRRCHERKTRRSYDLVLRLRPDVYRVGPTQPYQLLSQLRACHAPKLLYGELADPGSTITAADNVLWAVPETFDAIFLGIYGSFDAIYEHNTFRPPQMILQVLSDLNLTNRLCQSCRLLKRESKGRVYTRRLCLK